MALTRRSKPRSFSDLLEHLSGDDLVVKRQSVRELVELHTGIDLAPRVQSPEDFFQAASRIAKIGAKKGDSWQDLFFKLWVSSVEPDLDPGKSSAGL
jgi:elongation factor P--beta-lysine ligase